LNIGICLSLALSDISDSVKQNADIIRRQKF